jgi:hypothetical protein
MRASAQKMRWEAAAEGNHSPYEKPRLSGTLHPFAIADKLFGGAKWVEYETGGALLRPEIYVAAHVGCG